MGKIIGEGITFDDVLLVPSYSEVIPNQVDLSTYLTKKIKLNIPMMSAGRIPLQSTAWQLQWPDRGASELSIKICQSNSRQKKWTR